MNEKIIDIVDERDFKGKCKAKWYTVKQKCKDGFDWVINHPMEFSMICGGIGVVLGTGSRIVKQIHNYNEELDNRRTVYCNDIQSNVRLRHELNYYEARELRDRMNSGETKFEALDKMGLLKK